MKLRLKKKLGSIQEGTTFVKGHFVNQGQWWTPDDGASLPDWYVQLHIDLFEEVCEFCGSHISSDKK